MNTISDKNELVEFLHHLFATQKVTILTMGHPLRGDDNVGNYIGAHLRKNISSDRVQLIEAQTTPNHFLSPITQFRPEVILIIDATDMEFDGGTLLLFKVEDELKRESATTHYQGVETILEYLELELGYRPQIQFLCIQIEQIDLEGGLSPSVLSTANWISTELNKVLKTIL